ncbi:MAG: helix-turn-helix domain-containing protein [Vicinamibacterales bacterium]
MPTNSARIASPPGESTLDARLCAELGAQLARAREAQGLTIAQVAERLLLSARQAKALETVEFTAFHNATFHLGALRKYVALLALDDTLLNRVADSLVKPDPQAILLIPAESSEDANVSRSGRALSIVGLALLMALLAGGGYYLARARAAESASAPMSIPPAVAPSASAASAATSVPVAREPAVVTASDASAASAPDAGTSAAPADPESQGFGVVRAQRATWLFLRDLENVVTERPLAQGESFALETQPSYLAIGTTEAELTIGGRSVDLSRFVSNGQIRIKAGDFDALAQGASPIPAPMPVTQP